VQPVPARDSEVSVLAAGGGGPLPISPLLATIVAAALRAAELTDGAVDPTLGSALVAADTTATSPI